ncbi:MAG: hypothetical protein M1818_005303 [Claussenomyces sp. TS43310]|nr:MAG: hypothetical protein M1818_005303 [Claussenomyces sp. TS43310]
MQFQATIVSLLGLTAFAMAAPSADPATILARDNTGDLTYYEVGLGACGVTNVDTDMIAAISEDLYDANNVGTNPNNNPLCGKFINISYGGKTLQVQVEDRCTGCAYYDLDLSPSAFQQFADESVGRLTGATWNWA